jgi:hypothetical protein
MAWIRLSDDYNDHPKFDNLSDGAFRLWHQAMGYCRKYQTDGLIASATVKKFKAYRVKRMTELTTPPPQEANALWVPVEGFGIKVHDYLQWNPSKDEENERRSTSRERMRVAREQRKEVGVAPPVTSHVRANSVQTSCDVPGREGSITTLSEKEEEEIERRAGRLLRELYPAWYQRNRHGARLRVVTNSLAFGDAVTVCSTWDDERIEKLARIFLTTDDDWISRTDRGFRVFALKASWADDKLTAWEAEQAKRA